MKFVAIKDVSGDHVLYDFSVDKRQVVTQDLHCGNKQLPFGHINRVVEWLWDEHGGSMTHDRVGQKPAIVPEDLWLGDTVGAPQQRHRTAWNDIVTYIVGTRTRERM